MAKYEVVAETLGANPTYSKGDIIEDIGDLKAPYDISYLLRIGAIEETEGVPADRSEPAAETTASAPAPTGPDISAGLLSMSGAGVAAGQQTSGSESQGAGDLSGVDLDDDQRAALADAGILNAADVQEASDEQILAVKGIGPAALMKLREATKG